MHFFIIVFNNTHEAMSGEKITEENNIKAIVVPTPTYITKSCGISLRFSESELEKVERLAEENKIKFKNIYKKDKEGFKLFK